MSQQTAAGGCRTRGHIEDQYAMEDGQAGRQRSNSLRSPAPSLDSNETLALGGCPTPKSVNSTIPNSLLCCEIIAPQSSCVQCTRVTLTSTGRVRMFPKASCRSSVGCTYRSCAKALMELTLRRKVSELSSPGITVSDGLTTVRLREEKDVTANPFTCIAMVDGTQMLLVGTWRNRVKAAFENVACEQPRSCTSCTAVRLQLRCRCRQIEKLSLKLTALFMKRSKMVKCIGVESPLTT
eukprot:752963-Hanusia_phi.AAC.2